MEWRAAGGKFGLYLVLCGRLSIWNLCWSLSAPSADRLSPCGRKMATISPRLIYSQFSSSRRKSELFTPASMEKSQWRIHTGLEWVMRPLLDQSLLPRRWDTRIGHAWVVSPPPWPEGQGSITESSFRTAWNAGGGSPGCSGQTKTGEPSQAPKRKAMCA